MDIVEKVKFWISCVDPRKFKEVLVKERGKGDLIEAAKNIFISYLIMAVPVGLFMFVIPSPLGSLAEDYFGVPFPLFLAGYVAIGAILAPAYFLIMQGIYWVLARLLGGKGEYREQAYLASLFTAGTYLITILALVPCIGSIVSLALLILMVYLQYMLTVSVHKLGSLKAAIVAVGPMLILMLMAIAIALYLTPVMVAGSAPVPVPVPVQ